MTINDDRNRRNANLDRRDGMSGGSMAALAVAGLLLLGGLFYAFSGDRTSTANNNSPRTEQSVPPATTGQGGAQSKMPQKDAR